MIEGSSTKTFARSKGMMFDEPALMHSLLDKLAAAVTESQCAGRGRRSGTDGV